MAGTGARGDGGRVQGELLSEPESGLSFRVHEPRPARPRRCVILVHGVEQNETALAALGASLPDDILVISVRAPLVIAPGRYAFFHVVFAAHGPEIVAAEAEASREQLILFVAAIAAQYDLRPRDLLIAGFSQGGIMSTCVALSAPELVAGFGLLAGRILPELKPAIAAPERLAHLRGLVAHGDLDNKLAVSWAHRAHAQLGELQVTHELHLYPCGHEVSTAMAADFRRWIDQTIAPA